MAITTDIQNFEAGIVRRLRASLHQAQMNFAQNRQIRKTMNELNNLTQRELDDLGIHRSNIGEIARNAVYND